MSQNEREALLGWIFGGEAPGSDVLRPAAGLDERLEVYRGGFSVRTFAALAAAFPRTRAVLGDAWHPLGRRFAYERAPAEPNLNLIGRRFPEFLGAALGEGHLGARLAALEWRAFELVHGPQPGPLDAEALAALTEDDRVGLTPAVAVASVAPDLLTAWPSEATAEAGWALLSGRDGPAELTPLTAHQRAFLDALADAPRLGTLVERLGVPPVELGALLAWAVSEALLVRG